MDGVGRIRDIGEGIDDRVSSWRGRVWDIISGLKDIKEQIYFLSSSKKHLKRCMSVKIHHSLFLP